MFKLEVEPVAIYTIKILVDNDKSRFFVCFARKGRELYCIQAFNLDIKIELENAPFVLILTILVYICRIWLKYLVTNEIMGFAS